MNNQQQNMSGGASKMTSYISIDDLQHTTNVFTVDEQLPRGAAPFYDDDAVMIPQPTKSSQEQPILPEKDGSFVNVVCDC